MTLQERVARVQLHGFTERQAGFLVTVMLHSGVCLPRHYETFAGIAHGQKTADFFDGLVARGYATWNACGHHRARLVHVQHKRLYTAIGEPNNRHRRPMMLPRAVERLMLLDAVLADRKGTWLANRARQGHVFHADPPDPQAGSAGSSPSAARAARPFGTSPRSCRSAWTPMDGASSSTC